MSYLARLNYNYKGKYYVTASMRYDGSSKLAEGHKLGDVSRLVHWLGEHLKKNL